MEISPIDLLYLTLTSLLFGACCGIFNDVSRLVRALLGVKYSGGNFERLYKLKLPIIKRSVGEVREGKIRQRLLGVIIFIQDIALFFVFGWGIAIINFYFNDGQFRAYAPIAAICGFVLYYFSLGRVFLYFSEALAFFARATILMVFHLFYLPFEKIAGLIIKIVKKLHHIVNKTLAKKEKKGYNSIKYKKVTEMAKKGFVNLVKEEHDDNKKVFQK